jgi:hypothetical protein
MCIAFKLSTIVWYTAEHILTTDHEFKLSTIFGIPREHIVAIDHEFEFATIRIHVRNFTNSNILKYIRIFNVLIIAPLFNAPQYLDNFLLF